MSIAQGTTHYGYPQVQLNDRPTFADFNPAFADIDAKLYGLITGAETDHQAITDLGTAVGNLRTDLGGVSDTATAAKNKADANEEAIGLLSTQVTQNTTKLGTKIDSNAIAEPYDTAATYDIGDIVTYSGQRYKCTTAVLVAEPFDATKWTGEDVETVLEHLQDEIDNIPTPTVTAADVDITPITGMTATQTQQALEELHSGLTKHTVEALVSITASDYTDASHLYTVPYDGYLTIHSRSVNNERIQVNDENGNELISARGDGTYGATGTLLVKKGMQVYFASENFTGPTVTIREIS